MSEQDRAEHIRQQLIALGYDKSSSRRRDIGRQVGITEGAVWQFVTGKIKTPKASVLKRYEKILAAQEPVAPAPQPDEKELEAQPDQQRSARLEQEARIRGLVGQFMDEEGAAEDFAADADLDIDELNRFLSGDWSLLPKDALRRIQDTVLSDDWWGTEDVPTREDVIDIKAEPGAAEEETTADQPAPDAVVEEEKPEAVSAASQEVGKTQPTVMPQPDTDQTKATRARAETEADIRRRVNILIKNARDVADFVEDTRAENPSFTAQDLDAFREWRTAPPAMVRAILGTVREWEDQDAPEEEALDRIEAEEASSARVQPVRIESLPPEQLEVKTGSDVDQAESQEPDLLPQPPETPAEEPKSFESEMEEGVEPVGAEPEAKLADKATSGDIGKSQADSVTPPAEVQVEASLEGSESNLSDEAEPEDVTEEKELAESGLESDHGIAALTRQPVELSGRALAAQRVLRRLIMNGIAGYEEIASRFGLSESALRDFSDGVVEPDFHMVNALLSGEWEDKPEPEAEAELAVGLLESEQAESAGVEIFDQASVDDELNQKGEGQEMQVPGAAVVTERQGTTEERSVEAPSLPTAEEMVAALNSSAAAEDESTEQEYGTGEDEEDSAEVLSFDDLVTAIAKALAARFHLQMKPEPGETALPNIRHDAPETGQPESEAVVHINGERIRLSADRVFAVHAVMLNQTNPDKIVRIDLGSDNDPDDYLVTVKNVKH